MPFLKKKIKKINSVISQKKKATVLCTALDSFASTSVRTEPCATSAIPEEKKDLSASAGNPQASARALADMWIKMAAFPDLALPCCCLAEIARACNYSSWFKFSSSQYPLETYKLRNMVRCRAILCLEVPIQCQRLQFYTRPWCQRFYRDFMAPLLCENTSAAWQLFFTAWTWGGSRRAPFGEGTLSPLRRYFKPLPKGGRGGKGGVNEEPKPP